MPRRSPRHFRAALVLVVLAACEAREAPPPSADHGVPFFDLVEGFSPRNARGETQRIDFDEGERGIEPGAGWSVPERYDDGTFAWALGTESRLAVSLVNARPLRLELRCAPLIFPDAPPQSVSIEVNGEPAGRLELEPRWQTYRLDTPAALWRPGRNDVRLRYAWAHRPSDVHEGSDDVRPLGVAWDWLRIGPGVADGAAPSVNASGVILPVFSGVDYFLELPGESVLDVPAVEPWELDGARPPARLEVEVEPRGGEARLVFTGTVDGPLRLPLGGSGPSVSRLSLRAVPGPAGPLRRLLGWTGLVGATTAPDHGLALRAPMLRAPAPVRPELAAPAARDARRRPNVILYLIDTLHADRLGCYGYERPISPDIDRFANGAIVFTNPFAPSSWTRASVASLFTGLFPHTHRAIDRKSRLETSFVTLAEALRESGYETAGIVTNGNVSEAFGFAQGFDHYEYLREDDRLHVHRLSDEVNEAAFRWLDARTGDRPFFLYLHTTDPHHPYTPKEPWKSRFAAGADASEGILERVKKVFRQSTDRQREIREHLTLLYDAEIAFNDASFGALVERLTALGLYEDSIVILVSDHGEEFLEHGGWKHGKTLYQEQLRVPFIVKLPGNAGAGRRSDLPVQLVDVMPTLLEWIGAPAADGVEGRSLVPALSGGGDDLRHRTILSHIRLDRRERHAVVVDGWKLVRSSRPRHDLELYGLEEDPGEREDRIDAENVLAGFLETELDRRFGLGPVTAAHDAEIDPRLEERLRALGYLQ